MAFFFFCKDIFMKEYFIYNNTTNDIYLNTINILLPAKTFFLLDNHTRKLYYSGTNLDTLITNEEILICKTNINNPPLEEDIYSPTKGLYILSTIDSAFEIHFFDPTNNINNTQDAIDITNNRLLSLTKDVVTLSLELLSLKDQEYYPGLSFFIDSFKNNNLLSSLSQGYILNQSGYVAVDQGDTFSIIDSSTFQFQQGILNNIEIIPTANGSLRKLRLVSGDSLLLHNMDDISSFSSSNNISLSQTSVSNRVLIDSHSLGISFNFDIDSIDNTQGFVTIPLSESGLDITDYKTLSFSILNPNYQENHVDYILKIKDINDNEYSFFSNSLNLMESYTNVVVSLDNVVGVDKTLIKSIEFLFEERTNELKIMEISGTPNRSWRVNNTDQLWQTFKTINNATCNKIRLEVMNNNCEGDLYIGISNIFGTTLGMTRVENTITSGTWHELFLEFDSRFILTEGNTYQLIFKTDSNNNWNIRASNNSNYSEGSLWRNYGHPQDPRRSNEDILFTLYKESIKDRIYIDNINMESESTYELNGNYISRKINLGHIPNQFLNVNWVEISGNDTINIRIKTSSSLEGLDAATWSNWYNNGDDISGLINERFLQYEIRWIDGDINNSVIIEEVNIIYELTGVNNATIISKVALVEDIPNNFIFRFQDELSNGGINYYISRDDGASWQFINRNNEGKYLAFNENEGKKIRVKAEITNDAKIFGWSVLMDKEIVT